MLKDISNNISLDLSSYVLYTVYDSSLNNLQNTEQDNLTLSNPLSKDVSTDISIDLSGYAKGNIKGTRAI